MSTITPRTRLVWRTADIIRTAAALAALGIIGAVGAGAIWLGILGAYGIGLALTGH